MKKWRENEAAGAGRVVSNLMIFLCAFLFCFILSALVGSILSNAFPLMSRKSMLTMSACQNIMGFCGAALITALLTTEKPFRFLGLSKWPGWRPFAGAVIVLMVGIPFLNQLIYYNSLMHFPEALSGIEQWMRDMENQTAEMTLTLLNVNSVGAMLAGVLIIGVLTGFSEELLFRGTLQRTLNQSPVFRQWSIWIVAFIFSAVHLQFYGFVPRLLLGAFFGYMLYSTGSIWPGAFAHALNNSLVVVTTWMERKNMIENSDQWGVATDGFPVTASISFIALILFFIFCYRFFFSSWRQKQ